MSILQAVDLKKYYGQGDNVTKALDGVSLTIEEGEFVAIVGTSGSGKSTLLHMMGGLDTPTSGRVLIGGKELFYQNEEKLAVFRRRHIGFVFQSYNLVPVLNVYENMVLPLQLDGRKADKKLMKQIVHALGLQDKLQLGNMDSLRDWGYAKDYVECMWMILQQDEPEDFVIATGEQHTVRDFTEKAFKAVGINLKWEGKGIDEKGIDTETGKVLVEVNKEWFRPTDVDNLWGDPTKAKTVLGWNPQKTSYEELINIMVKHDLELAKHEALLKNGGEK